MTNNLPCLFSIKGVFPWLINNTITQMSTKHLTFTCWFYSYALNWGLDFCGCYGNHPDQPGKVFAFTIQVHVGEFWCILIRINDSGVQGKSHLTFKSLDASNDNPGYNSGGNLQPGFKGRWDATANCSNCSTGVCCWSSLAAVSQRLPCRPYQFSVIMQPFCRHSSCLKSALTFKFLQCIQLWSNDETVRG